MNEQNLRTPTSSEAREIGRKGGIASGKARLRKKHGRELLRALLEMKETDPRIIEEMQRLGLADADITNEVVMHARQLEKAKRKADTNAYNAIAKVAGYDSININVPEGMIIRVDNEDQARRLETLGD